MKIKRLSWALLVLTLISSPPAYSYLVGRFSTLDQRIERSEAIAVVNVEQPVNSHALFVGAEPPCKCYIREVFKGDIPAKQWATLGLLPPEGFESFKPHSTYLVFLKKNSDPESRTSYESVYAEGAVVDIGWQNTERPTKGATTKDKIQTLIRNYIKQRDQAIQQENVLLNKMLK